MAADRISGAEGQRAGFDHEVALRDLREECLCEYIKAAWPIIEPVTRYLHNWHIDAIAEHLEAVTDGEIRRLIINLPPRYMKSICVSVMWPTWEWGPRNMPHARWMFCSHAADLSIRHSDDRRTVMTSPWYRECWGDRFKLVKSLESEYSNDHRGRVIATSVTGQATGKGYNRVVIDDFLDPEQALSDTLRTTANRIFDEKFSKRLDDKRKDAIVIVMPRLHKNDLAGHVLGPMKEEGWATLILPAEAEGRQKIVFPRSGTVVERQEGGPTTITRKEDPLIEEFARLAPKKDVLGVEVIDDGGLLWPERAGPKEIAEVKLLMGKDAFAGQYQQRPAPLGGGMIKRYWFRRYETKAMPAINRLILSLDTVCKEGQKSDYSVCEVWAQCAGGFYLLDLWRERVQFPDLRRAVLSLNQRWTPSALLIEDTARCQTLIQELRPSAVGPGGSDQLGFIPGQSPGGQFAGQAIAVVPINAGNDKIARAAAVSSLIEAGLVWLPEDSPWVEDFLHELCNFPVAQHDDQVAAMAYALTYLRGAAGKEEVYRQETQRRMADETALRRGEEPPRPDPSQPRDNPQLTRRIINGRPRKFPPDLKGVEFLVEGGLKVNEIVAWLDISRSTFFRRKSESKEFCDAVRRGRVRGIEVSNVQYERIKGGNLRAIIRFLRRRGRRADPNHCPAGGWSLMTEKWEAERRIIHALTPEERRLYRRLVKLACQHQKAAVRADHQNATDAGSPFGEALKPANRRTGRPTWSSPDLAIVEGLAERALTHAQLAACLGIERTTLYRKMEDSADFRDAVKRGEAKLAAFAIAKLEQYASNGSRTAIKFYLRMMADHHHSVLCMPPEERAKDLAWLQTRSFWTSAERWVFCQLMRRAEARLKQGPAGRGARSRAQGSRTKAASPPLGCGDPSASSGEGLGRG